MCMITLDGVENAILNFQTLLLTRQTMANQSLMLAAYVVAVDTKLFIQQQFQVKHQLILISPPAPHHPNQQSVLTKQVGTSVISFVLKMDGDDSMIDHHGWR